MTNEEKEAIEEAKKQIKEAHNLNELNVFMTDSTTLKTLLNLIDKLQKENSELKNMDLTTVYMKGFYDSESKWREKIKKIITPTPDNPIPIEVQISDMYEKFKKILEK